MAKNVKNKFPADKSGTKYSEFRNTKRNASGKTRKDQDAKQATSNTNQTPVQAAPTQ
jgi:hypothetical protein